MRLRVTALVDSPSRALNATQAMGYVHVAERSPRAIPEEILRAAENKTDPGARVLAMLGARAKTVTRTEPGGTASTAMSAA
jgi:hypothetical protein